MLNILTPNQKTLTSGSEPPPKTQLATTTSSIGHYKANKNHHKPKTKTQQPNHKSTTLQQISRWRSTNSPKPTPNRPKAHFNHPKTHIWLAKPTVTTKFT